MCNLQNKMWEPNLGQNGTKLGPKLGFGHFLKFGSFVFFEIAYNDSL